MQYRSLTFEEIDTLERNSCWAEDWSRVEVAEEGFKQNISTELCLWRYPFR